MCNNFVTVKRELLKADYARTFADVDERELERRGSLWKQFSGWTGWRRREWPAGVLRKGVRFYVFNKQHRALVGLYEIVHGNEFEFTSMETFACEVRRWCGEDPPVLANPTPPDQSSRIGDP